MLKVNELNIKKLPAQTQKNKITIKKNTTMETQRLNGWTGTDANTTTTSNGNKKAFFRVATHAKNANGE